MHAPHARELFVKRRGLDLRIESPGEEEYDDVERREEDEVLSRDEEDVAEEVARRIGIPWGLRHKEDAYTHPNRPDRVDDRVLALLRSERNDADDRGGEDRERERAHHGGDPRDNSGRGKIERHPDAAEHGVGDRTGES